MSRSTGNDIVSLATVDKLRTREFRFYSRILSVSEQTLFADEFAGTGLVDMPFENFVWLLWSVKESAYKMWKRNRPGLVFSPTKIIVRQVVIPDGGEDFYRGFAIWGSERLYFRSMIRPGFIATVVDDQETLKKNWWGIRRIDRTDHLSQSSAVRAFVLNKLQSIFPRQNLRIDKDPEGHPIVCSGAAELDIPVSLAHHGHYIAYSFVLPGFFRMKSSQPPAFFIDAFPDA
jgi:phosphopantetheinyl transferase (holo-ACP synthase)